MTVDPSGWKPGTLIVNRDVMLAAQLDERDNDGWHVLVADMETAIPEWRSDAELSGSWQPLEDVIARGWAERTELPIRYCPLHDHIAWHDRDRCDDAIIASLKGPCPLTRPLSYPEGDTE